MFSKLQGPPKIPNLGNAFLVISQNSSEGLWTFLGFMEKYVPVVTIWFGLQLLIAISDPKDIKKLVSHAKFCTRGPYFLI
jgi:hypothetical protein